MHRALVALLSTFAFAAVAGCQPDPVGAPCESDVDCEGDLTCDVHDGQGTCQEAHGHGDTHGDETHGDETHGDETHGDTGGSLCEDETRDDEFAVGLSKSGVGLTATFVSADPAPPIKGDNTWVLALTNDLDEAVDGLTIVVTPMMPDHGHGSPIEAIVTATGTPGEYEISPVNLSMAGYWEITLDITNGQDQDAVMFGFCVE
jgi:hypothetical protein